MNCQTCGHSEGAHLIGAGLKSLRSPCVRRGCKCVVYTPTRTIKEVPVVPGECRECGHGRGMHRFKCSDTVCGCEGFQ